MRNKTNNNNIPKNFNKNTDIISTLIHEYLYKNEYINTLDSYQEELGEKIKSGKYYSTSYKEISDTSLLKHFESGNKIEFFKQWKRLIPNHMKLIEPTLCKLDFYLEIYFALFPIMGNKQINQKAQSELKRNMEDFKKFLEKKEIELSKTTEFLAYYALPYIPNPKGHPTYAQLFKPEWTNDLKTQLINCVKFYLPSPDKKYPTMYDLVNSKNVRINNLEHKEESKNNNLNNIDNNINNIENNKIINEIKAENEKLVEEIKKLKNKEEKSKIAFIDSQKTWSNLALNIISYSFGLIDIYNNVTNNTQNTQVEKIRQKLVKYQNFLKRNMEELEKNKNANNSSLMVKKEELDGIENSVLNTNNNSNINNIINYSMKNNINNIKNNEKESLIVSNNNNVTNNNMITINENENNINNYSRDEKNYINIENQDNQNDNIENENENDNLQKGKSIQIDYEPDNLIDMKRFIQALNRKILVDDNKLVYIFREIRLRIFRRNNRKLSELTLYELFMYDLFGTLSKSSYLFHELINNQILNLEVMKILNSLASLNKGRNYLLAKETLIDDIVQCMIREKTDSDLRQKCLGTIQKFTLRSQPQSKLIELNVIHYIVNLFAYEADSLSDYTIEYGLALIMNLSLRKAGREKFEAIADKTIQILQKFMDKDNIQVLTCINGTLYSLLKKEKFKIEARNKGLDIKLKNAKIENQQLKKQITYILEELDKPPEEEEEYDENFEEDINEKDEEENNYDDYSEGESIDENLLEEHYKMHYKILGEFIIKDNELEKIEENKILKFMQNDPSMAKALVNNNKSMITNSMTSTFRADDGYKPLHRPTTPMSNMSMTGTSFIYKNNNYKENEYDNNKIKIPEDSAKAFMKNDKIKRTPPRNYDK